MLGLLDSRVARSSQGLILIIYVKNSALSRHYARGGCLRVEIPESECADDEGAVKGCLSTLQMAKGRRQAKRAPLLAMGALQDRSRAYPGHGWGGVRSRWLSPSSHMRLRDGCCGSWFCLPLPARRAFVTFRATATLPKAGNQPFLIILASCHRPIPHLSPAIWPQAKRHQDPHRFAMPLASRWPDLLVLALDHDPDPIALKNWGISVMGTVWALLAGGSI